MRGTQDGSNFSAGQIEMERNNTPGKVAAGCILAVVPLLKCFRDNI